MYIYPFILFHFNFQNNSRNGEYDCKLGNNGFAFSSGDDICVSVIIVAQTLNEQYFLKEEVLIFKVHNGNC